MLKYMRKVFIVAAMAFLAMGLGTEFSKERQL